LFSLLLFPIIFSHQSIIINKCEKHTQLAVAGKKNKYQQIKKRFYSFSMSHIGPGAKWAAKI
jgi:hypothetical protein